MKIHISIRIFAIVLTAALLAGILPISASGENDDFVIDGTVLVRYTGDAEDVVIPGDLGITEIKFSAFIEKNMKSVVIPDGVTRIGDAAFMHCVRLEDITVPDSVVSIGQDAFFNTKWLDEQPEYAVVYAGRVAYQYKGEISLWRTISLAEGTKGIADHAFTGYKYQDDLYGIHLPDSLVHIGEWAFAGCDRLEYVTLPDGLMSIGDRAFFGCNGLTAITVPASVSYIGHDAFYYYGQGLVRCNRDSYTHAYAEENDISHIFIEDAIPGNITYTGRLNVGDVRMVLQILCSGIVSKYYLSEAERQLLDFFGDGYLKIDHARLMLQVIVGKLPEIPRYD
ncbi:MAG: leucine-rich repeat domain-containing protein [Oscillospiraceae bacterium]|nr:leucine-rich repeat domain-containing protein [Oscillospiraceae bacterium]